jgi:hypothetical protein
MRGCRVFYEFTFFMSLKRFAGKDFVENVRDGKCVLFPSVK